MNGILEGRSVRIRDPKTVKSKLEKLISGGSSRLQLITDFDWTISRAYDSSGKQCSTTHGVFDKSASRYDPAIAKQLQDLTSKYKEIEFNPNLTNEQKTPHMLIWWKVSHELIVKCGFNRANLTEMMKEAHDEKSVMLRDGAEGFLQECCVADIPVVLFSAGIGTLIDILLRQLFNGVMPPNLHIISNMMEFDQNDNVVGFKDPLIHTFNKNSSVVTGERDFFHRLAGRDNVILMGDTMGDLNMDVGVEHETTVLKIGFLNSQVDELLESYMNGYDIVLVEDQTMHVPLTLLRLIHGLPGDASKSTDVNTIGDKSVLSA